jgi:hypothetical protein
MKFDNEKYKSYYFIANGLISISGIGEGRLIPCLIFEKIIAQEIAELCQIHKDSQPGDVETTWVKPLKFKLKTEELVLKIKFKNPVEFTFGIIFNLEKHFSLIDGIILSQSLRIEAGEFGDKISDLKNEDILIEVQRTNFNWQNYLDNILKKKYKDKGVLKNQINQLVQQHIKAMREIWNLEQNKKRLLLTHATTDLGNWLNGKLVLYL